LTNTAKSLLIKISKIS